MSSRKAKSKRFRQCNLCVLRDVIQNCSIYYIIINITFNNITSKIFKYLLGVSNNNEPIVSK